MKYKIRIYVFLTCGVLCIAIAILLARSRFGATALSLAEKASYQIRLKDSEGKPLEGATVIFYSGERFAASKKSNRQGIARFVSEQKQERPSIYVRKQGYAPKYVPRFGATKGCTTVDVAMEKGIKGVVRIKDFKPSWISNLNVAAYQVHIEGGRGLVGDGFLDAKGQVGLDTLCPGEVEFRISLRLEDGRYFARTYLEKVKNGELNHFCFDFPDVR
jgi:hypothetical protein